MMTKTMMKLCFAFFLLISIAQATIYNAGTHAHMCIYMCVCERSSYSTTEFGQ